MEIQKALAAASRLADELVVLKKELDGRAEGINVREAAVKKAEEGLAYREKALADRESAIKPIENIDKALADIDRARGELITLQREVGQKQTAIQDFEALSLQKIEKAKQALGNLGDLKAQLVNDRATLEAEKVTYKDRILKDIQDRIKLGA